MVQQQNGGRKHKLSSEDARRALSVYASGKTLEEAAQSVGVTPATLGATLERLGLRRRNQRPRMLNIPLIQPQSV